MASTDLATVQLLEGLNERIRLLEAALRDAHARLTLRSQIDVLVGHELRTPLTVIVGALETLVDAPLDVPTTKELIAAAARHARSLAEVADDLLEAAPGAGVVLPRASVRTFSLRQVASDALDAVPELDRGRVSFSEGDLMVNSARGRVRAMVANLFQNAARYGGPGAVECRWDLHGGLVTVSIADRGPGLSGREAEVLFDPFVQGPDGCAGGRGIGLYLVRMLARSLGGEAEIVARPGGGTIALVRFPQRRVEDPTYGRTPDRTTAADSGPAPLRAG